MISEDDLNALIAQTYVAALDGDQWLPLLDFTTEVFGGVGTSFEIFDKTSGLPVLMELGSGLKHVCAPDYIEHYAKTSPRVRYAETVASGDVTYDYAILTEEEIEADEFYNECMARFGLRYFVAGHILDGNGHMGALAVQFARNQGHVDAPGIALMGKLLPHIQQAVDLKYRLADTPLARRGLRECLEQIDEAALLVGSDGKVLHANGAAEAIFAAHDGVVLKGGSLNFHASGCNDTLDRAMKGLTDDLTSDIASGTSFIAPRSSGARPYLVSVRRLPNRHERFDVAQLGVAAIVFIRDPETFNRLDTDLLRESYHLTAAEVQVAVSLDQGHSLKEIARQRGVAPTTVKTQLYALMAKLSVKRQVDLVRLLERYRRPFS